MILAAALFALQLGDLNRLAESATPGNASDIRIVQNHVTKTLTCNGNAAYILGNQGTFTVTGPCKSVQVMGNGNQVTVTEATSISVQGNGNTVSWKNPAAKPSNVGNGNTLHGPK